MGAQQVRVFSNSQLVVNQVLKLNEVGEDNMMVYLALVKQVVGKLKGLLIAQILREENVKTNRLARLASSPKANL